MQINLHRLAGSIGSRWGVSRVEGMASLDSEVLRATSLLVTGSGLYTLLEGATLSLELTKAPVYRGLVRAPGIRELEQVRN